VPIYIVDDSTNEETKERILNLKEEYNYDYLYYIKNEDNLGHDKNCIKTISVCETKYVWYLGDSTPLIGGVVQKILEILNKNDYDIICYSSFSRRFLNNPTKLYEDDKELLLDIGWHLTKTGVTIYIKSGISFNSFDVSKYKNFPQFALIFSIIKNQGKTNLFWLNEKLIYGNGQRKSYWSEKPFETFVDDFGLTLRKLPQNYSEEIVSNVIRKHSLNTGILGYYKIIDLRTSKNWDLKQFYLRKLDFKKYSNVNLKVIWLLSILPPKMIKIFYKYYVKWFVKV
jgi:abequosyltransferase